MSSSQAFLDLWPEAVALFPRIFVKQLIARDDPALAFHTEARIEPPDQPVALALPGYVVSRKTAAHEFGHLFHWLIRLLDPAFEEDFWRWRFGAWPSAPKSWAIAAAEAGNVWAFLPGEILAETFAAAVLGYIESDKGMDWGYDLTAAGGAIGARDFFTKAMNKVRPPVIVVAPPSPGGGTPTMLQVVNLPSPNFGSNGVLGVHGRTQPIRYIVLHTTEGTDSRSWLTNRASNVSATYLVREEGIYRLVDEADVAWHAGRIIGIPTTPLYSGINPNEESIGIEIEGFAGQTISAAKFAFTIALLNDIRARRGDLPRVGHFELSPGDRSDPGLQNFTAIQNALGGWLDMNEEQLRRIIREESTIPLSEKLNAGFNTTMVALLRRTARWIRLGIPRDPAGDTSVTPPRAYTDDQTPLG